MRVCFRLILSGLLLFLCACQEKEPQAPSPAAKALPFEASADPSAPKTLPPPSPPLEENFEEAPQLSFFPRIAAYRPEDSDTKNLSLWKNYIEHLIKISGVLPGSGIEESRGFSLRSIRGLDSVAFFSPIQYARSFSNEYFIRATDPLRQSTKKGWKQYSFDISTSPKTRMIHLVLYREGESNRSPVRFDNIRIKEVL